MSNLLDGQPFWILIIIHSLTIVGIIYFKVVSKSLSRIDVTTSTIDDHKKKPADNFTIKDVCYMKFPKNSWKTFTKCLKVIFTQNNHLMLKIFFRDFTFIECFLEVLSQNILYIGILGISGIEFKQWSNTTYFTSGITAPIVARVFHFGYSASPFAKGGFLHPAYQ